MNNDINVIGIIGAGKMGTNLFHYLLDFDFPITWVCSKQSDPDKLIKSFQKKIKRLMDAGLLDENSFIEKQNNIRITNDLEQIHKCDLIIETITENLDLKSQLFRKLDKIAGENCIFVSNSSSFTLSELLPSESRKDKIIGLHFFYFVAMKNIVEVIVSDLTSNDVVKNVNQFLRTIHMDPLIQNEDHSFILNRIFLDLQNEAYLIVHEGAITIRQIDMLVKKHFSPVGVFDFCDSVGIDIMLTSVLNYIKNYPDMDRYLLFTNELQRLVGSNKSGIKTGEGFYTYPAEILSEEEVLNDIPYDVSENAVGRLRNTLSFSIHKFSTRSGIGLKRLHSAMKEYLGSEKDLI